jgi:hypothetical protein
MLPIRIARIGITFIWMSVSAQIYALPPTKDPPVLIEW